MSFHKQAMSQSVQVAIQALLMLRYDRANHITLEDDRSQQFGADRLKQKLAEIADLCQGSWNLILTHDIVDDSNSYDILKSRLVEFEIKKDHTGTTLVSIGLISEARSGCAPTGWYVHSIKVAGSESEPISLSVVTEDFPSGALLCPEMKATTKYYLLDLVD